MVSRVHEEITWEDLEELSIQFPDFAMDSWGQESFQEEGIVMIQVTMELRLLACK